MNTKIKINIPNCLTYARILMIPIFVVVFYLPGHYMELVTAGIFCLAALTDWLDGYLARKLNQSSRFGAFLDPVADKLLISTALVLIAAEYGSVWIAVPAAVIVCREIVISALREWMAEVGKQTSVSVGYLGKLKTAAQMVSIILLLSQPADWGRGIVWVGVVLMYVAVALTVVSMFYYLKAARKALD